MGKPIIYRRVSFTDLQSVGFVLIVEETENNRLALVKSCDKAEIEKALFTLGLKINSKLEIQNQCEHRRADGKRTTNYSFVGEERSDKKWLESGYASDDVKLNNSKFTDMVAVARQLGRGGIQ